MRNRTITKCFIFIQILFTIQLIGYSALISKNNLIITPEELKEKQVRSDNFMLVDIRSRTEFEKKHIKGAMSIPYTNLVTKKLPHEKEIVIYCSDYGCDTSKKAVKKMAELGYKKIKALDGGLLTWVSRHYPVEGTEVVEDITFSITAISADELKALTAKEGNLLLLDVRNEEEFNAGHIPGARNIIPEKFKSEIKNIKESKLVIVYSQNGQINDEVIAALSMKSMKNIRNLSGGLLLWQRKGYEISVK
ncbi:MAG: hypothetical protein A2252_05835 [Elusimicrobia bacterium RIFOXYA2_FULL_39_19]|nr:MAG: hypothetical protein A2252_05835 [Elusimicrobia bacterium RIFOXYA2_FULL_39_19]